MPPGICGAINKMIHPSLGITVLLGLCRQWHSKFLQNVGDMVSHPESIQSSLTLLWETQIMKCVILTANTFCTKRQILSLYHNTQSVLTWQDIQHRCSIPCLCHAHRCVYGVCQVCPGTPSCLKKIDLHCNVITNYPLWVLKYGLLYYAVSTTAKFCFLQYVPWIKVTFLLLHILQMFIF